MDTINFQKIDEDYYSTKRDFQKRENKEVARELSHDLPSMFEEVFYFLVDSFHGKLRNDGKTPLVFHSIYVTKLLYVCGVRDEENLLIGALHDVLEDTWVRGEDLRSKDFMRGRERILERLETLTEDKGLSREPDGKTLPPRYREHISRMVGAPKEVINVEIIDRFSDLMDLEYITDLDEEERKLRLESKMIKVKSFVENVTFDRSDYNSNCLKLFEYKVRQIQEQYNLTAEAELFSS